MKSAPRHPTFHDDISDIRKLLFQLTKSRRLAHALLRERLMQMNLGEGTYIAVIRTREMGRIIGMGTLVVIELATGRKAIIEDVVIDRRYRGQGLGRKMMEMLVRKARKLKVRHIDLTSRPERVSAGTLYRSMGFCERDTKVYRLRLDRSTS